MKSTTLIIAMVFCFLRSPGIERAVDGCMHFYGIGWRVPSCITCIFGAAGDVLSKKRCVE